MQALEELALSYDTKDRQFDAIHTEKEVLTEENERIQVSERGRGRAAYRICGWGGQTESFQNVGGAKVYTMY